MTVVVLALAGLTCGDGGPGMGPARAPVVPPIDLTLPRRGMLRLGRLGPYEMQLDKSGLCFRHPNGWMVLAGFALVEDGRGGYSATWGRLTFPATCRLQGDRLILSVGGDDWHLWTFSSNNWHIFPPDGKR